MPRGGGCRAEGEGVGESRTRVGDAMRVLRAAGGVAWCGPCRGPWRGCGAGAGVWVWRVRPGQTDTGESRTHRRCRSRGARLGGAGSAAWPEDRAGRPQEGRSPGTGLLAPLVVTTGPTGPRGSAPRGRGPAEHLPRAERAPSLPLPPLPSCLPARRPWIGAGPLPQHVREEAGGGGAASSLPSYFITSGGGRRVEGGKSPRASVEPAAETALSS